MKYSAKANIEDGQVLCASSYCEGCQLLEMGKCVDVVVEDNISEMSSMEEYFKKIIDAKNHELEVMRQREALYVRQLTDQALLQRVVILEVSSDEYNKVKEERGTVIECK